MMGNHNQTMRRHGFLLAALLCVVPVVAHANNSVHISYHWHLHQPIYWPDYKPGWNRYQFAKDSVDLKLANTGNFYAGSPYEHPRNQLVNGDGGTYDDVFTKADRLGAYQDVPKNSLSSLLWLPDAGAQISYSGSLQENVWSFGKDNAYGYFADWNSHNTTARGWTTSGGKPRADLVGMTYHHAFSPLLPKSVLRKEIQIFKEIWWKNWGGNSDKSDHSKGFWPPEAAFSRHMISVLREEGYNWVIVPNSHLARTCQNYLDVATRGTSGWNIDPPNAADVLGPTVPANQWWSDQKDGRGGAFPAPFAYQAHKAKYVNPETGAETKITLVPMCDMLSYMNGFGTMDTAIIPNKIAPWNDPAKPSLVLMAHDGDNAWGGGSSYYSESVPQFTDDAHGKGYHPTTVEQFLAEWPVPETDVVHIEDGAWVNAANDWGHPQFINWLWPPARAASDPLFNINNPATYFDFETPGWAEDWRNWAVLMAGANFCETAEQITLTTGGSVQAWKIQEPYQTNGTYNVPNPAERAWHFYLGGLDSGFMYYGIAIDDEVKQTIACNRAIGLAKIVTDAHPTLDQTPPTVFKPQRFPWNPGGKGWGPLTKYKPVGFDGAAPWPSDFYIWTHVFDLSGVTNVTLKIRVDNDGVNPLASNQNETYAGGAEVGAWISLPMTQRVLSKTQGDNGGAGEPDQGINFFILPDYIADYYFAKVTGYRNVLLDYYVEAADSRGNVHKSDIQHVFVYDDGTGPGEPPAAPTGVTATGVSSAQINITWTASATATGYLVKRAGTPLGTTAGTSYAAAGLTAGTEYCYTVVATNAAGNSADSSAACATTHSAGSPPPFVMDGQPDQPGYRLANPGMTLYAAVRGDVLYVATYSPGVYPGDTAKNDHFIMVTDQLAPLTPAFPAWSKSGSNTVATSQPFLGAESVNDYIGWQNTGASNAAVKALTNTGTMEGVLNLTQAFGALPSTIYLFAAAYNTQDGGALVAQAPAGNSNGHIESNEFLAIPLVAILDNNGDGLYDRLDPELDFVVSAITRAGNVTTVTWNCVPGHVYQLTQSAAPAGVFDPVGAPVAAGASEITISQTVTNSALADFYKVKLILP